MYVIQVDEVICSARCKEAGSSSDALDGTFVRRVVEFSL